MKKFNRLCIAVIICMIGLIAVANCFLLFGQKRESGRPYRVEVSRLVRQMEEEGRIPDLSNCAYVTAIVPDAGEGLSFYEGNSDYVIREIDGERYRFEYTARAKEITSGMFWTVNVALGLMGLLVLFVLLYVRQKVLRPFTKMENVPYELSRGNLTMPLTESKPDFSDGLYGA